VGFLLEEFVVEVQVTFGDARLAYFGVVGKGDGLWGWEFSAEAFLMKDVLQVVGAEGLVGESDMDGLEEFLTPMGIGEEKDAGQMVVDVDLGMDEAAEVGLGGWAECEEFGDEALAPGVASGVQKGSGMFGLLEIGVFVEGSRMGDEEVGFVVDADFGGSGLEGEFLAGELGRDGVAVGLEVNAEGHGGLDGNDDGGVVGIRRERKEQGSLFLKEVNGSFVGGAVKTDVRHAVSPLESSGVDLVEVAEFAAHEESILDVTDPGLDSALFVRRSLPTKCWFEGIESGERHKAWVETDLIARSLKHDALEIVVEDLGGVAAEKPKSVLVAAQKFFESLADGELEI
jgi:hypothetical protein